MADAPNDPMSLLNEWFVWWFSSSDAPPKMPDALHIRTAMALRDAGQTVPMTEWLPRPGTAPERPTVPPST